MFSYLPPFNMQTICHYLLESRINFTRSAPLNRARYQTFAENFNTPSTMGVKMISLPKNHDFTFHANVMNYEHNKPLQLRFGSGTLTPPTVRCNKVGVTKCRCLFSVSVLAGCKSWPTEFSSRWVGSGFGTRMSCSTNRCDPVCNAK